MRHSVSANGMTSNQSPNVICCPTGRPQPTLDAIDHREIHRIAVRLRLEGQRIGDEVGERRFTGSEAVAHRIGAQVGIIRHAADDAVAIGAHAGQQRLHMLALEGFVNRQINERASAWRA